VAAGLLCALVVAGCGGGGGGGAGPAAGARLVDVYSLLPLRGRDAGAARALVSGVRLALAQRRDRAGQVFIRYEPLDDSDPHTGRPSPGLAVQRALRVATDPNAVVLIGGFAARATAAAVPVVSRAGIAQIVATSEPGLPRPSGRPTQVRLFPSDAVEAAAVLQAVKQARCPSAVVAWGGPGGRAMAGLIGDTRRLYGIDVVPSPGAAGPSGVRAVIQTVRETGARCLVFAGTPAGGGAAVTRAVAASNPGLTIIGTHGMCVPAWSAASAPPVAARVEAPTTLLCTRPTLPVGALPGGAQFLDAYRAAYHRLPQPYAIDGYEAMMLTLDTLAELGDAATDRSAVLRGLFAVRRRESALGTYDVTRDGDVTLRSIGLYRVGAAGRITFLRGLTPPKVL
jgi:ABC-type branched-subunit amino acid transport system substrate-binding protein